MRGGAALQCDADEFRSPTTPAADGGDDHVAVDSSLRRRSTWAISPSGAVAAAAARGPGPKRPPPSLDVLEKTRELLTPVVDLIALQQEMQGALQRLATSLQTFATGVITENVDKNATVESRLEALESELELTRARLRETEALLAAGGARPPRLQPGRPGRRRCSPAARSRPPLSRPPHPSRRSRRQSRKLQTPTPAAKGKSSGTLNPP